MQQIPAPRRAERGFASLALVTVLMPLMLMVGVFLQTMHGRQNRLQTEIREEQALMAAEAGIDIALNEARRGLLLAGPDARYEFHGSLQHGSRYETVCSYLGADGEDNDDDAIVDEVDEDVFRVVSTGSFAGSTRRIATYMGFVRYLPALTGALMLTNPGTAVRVQGSPMVSGRNHRLDGSLAASGSVFGVTMAPPGTLTDLQKSVAANDPRYFVGATPTPSLGSSEIVDVPALVTYAHHAARTVVVGETLKDARFGTVAEPVIAYREGDLRLAGNTVGHGLLVVEGDLHISGTFRWNGVIVCTGELIAGTGNGDVFGAVILGPGAPGARLGGNMELSFSTEAIELAARLLGRYVALGWQEIGAAAD